MIALLGTVGSEIYISKVNVSTEVGQLEVLFLSPRELYKQTFIIPLYVFSWLKGRSLICLRCLLQMERVKYKFSLSPFFQLNIKTLHLTVFLIYINGLSQNLLVKYDYFTYTILLFCLCFLLLHPQLSCLMFNQFSYEKRSSDLLMMSVPCILG